VVLVSNHYLESRRKAGFHWLADAFWRAGWDVLFVTESISLVSWLRRDLRFSYPIFREAHQLRTVRERMASYVWLTPYHPMNLRYSLLNHVAEPFHYLYRHFPLRRIKRAVSDADVFVFDSDHGLFLFDRFKRLNPRAKFIYRVSDDIPMMRHHPIVLRHETRIAPQFDLISVPCDYIHKRFAHLPQVILQKHGLKKELFDAPSTSPYQGPGPFIVYAGKDYVDRDFISRAVRLLPNMSFHVFGAIPDLPSSPNLHAYGERPFADIVPYLKHADVGLQARSYSPGAECLTDSLKMLQYTYCRLPIVAPLFLKHDRPHVFYYEPGDDASIVRSVQDALAYDRAQIDTNAVQSWDEIASRMMA
jgi:2-beta-glucuronyltransferase